MSTYDAVDLSKVGGKKLRGIIMLVRIFGRMTLSKRIRSLASKCGNLDRSLYFFLLYSVPDFIRLRTSLEIKFKYTINSS